MSRKDRAVKEVGEVKPVETEELFGEEGEIDPSILTDEEVILLESDPEEEPEVEAPVEEVKVEAVSADGKKLPEWMIA